MPLTTEQQQSLTELKTRREQLVLKQQEEQTSNAELLQELKGHRPRPGPLPRTPFLGSPEAFRTGKAPIGDPRAFQLRELKRRRADLMLQAQGKTPIQIQFVLDVNKKVEKPPALGRTVGGIAGAVGSALALNLIPGFAVLPEEILTIPLALMKTAKAITPIIGAGIGGAAGESIQIGIEEQRLATKNEILKAAFKEVAFEAGGRAFVRAGKFAFSPFIKQVVPEAAEITSKYGNAALRLTPSQMDNRFSLSVAEEIAKGGFGGREIFEEAGKKSGRAARAFADNLLENMADGASRLGPKQLGEEVVAGFTRPTGFVYRGIDDIVDGLYKQFDELTDAHLKRIIGTVQVPTGELDKFGKPITKVTRRVIEQRLVSRLSPGFEELEQFVPTGVSTRKLKRFWIDVLKENKAALKPGKKAAFTLTPGAISEGESTIRNLADVIPHKTMRQIRSRVLRDIRKLHRDVGQDEVLLKRFEQVTFDALTDPAAVKNAPRETQALFNNTRELYKSLRNSIDTRFPEQLAKRLIVNPSRVIKEMFPQNNPTAIKALRQSLVEPIKGRPSAEGRKLWIQLRTGWFADAVEKSTREEVIKPHIFESAIRTMGPEAIKEMVPDAVGKEQLRIIRNMLTAMSKKPSSGASLFIRGGQVGGLFMLYNGTKEGDFLQVATGGALVAGPRFFAKMAAHPLGARLMASGIKLKPGSTSLVPIAARMVNLSRQIDRENALKPKVPKTIGFQPRELRGFGGRGF